MKAFERAAELRGYYSAIGASLGFLVLLLLDHVRYGAVMFLFIDSFLSPQIDRFTYFC